MSYILDALRKSDHQRRLGTTPTLGAAPPAAITTVQPGLTQKGWLWAVAAIVLVSAGILLSWLLSEKNATETAPVPDSYQSARPSGAPTFAPPPASPVPAPALAAEAEPPPPRAPQTAAVPAPAAESAPADLAETTPVATPALPREIADLSISFHVYSTTPAERRVMIDNLLLRQGDALPSGMKVEQITADGVVLGFHGQSFRRGVRQ